MTDKVADVSKDLAAFTWISETEYVNRKPLLNVCNLVPINTMSSSIPLWGCQVSEKYSLLTYVYVYIIIVIIVVIVIIIIIIIIVIIVVVVVVIVIDHIFAVCFKPSLKYVEI